MPIRHETPDGFKQSGQTWFLKTGENAVCGELTLETLAQWAETGRILSDHEVSCNGETWVKADTVPELKMDWFATLKSGATHGPVNLLALPDLYRRGVIDATTVLRNKLTNREIPAAAILRGMRDPTKAPKLRPPMRKIQPRRPPSPEPAAPAARAIPAIPAEAKTIVIPSSPSPLPGVRPKGAAPPSLTPSDENQKAEAPVQAETIAPKPPSPPPSPGPPPEVKRLEGQVERLKKELGEHKDRMAELLKQLADETALHEQLRARHAKTVTEIQSKSHDEQQNAVGQKELAELKERCEKLEADNRRLKDTATADAEQQKHKLAALEENQNKERDKSGKIQAQAAEKEAAWKARISDMESENDKLRSEVKTLKSDLEEAREEAVRLKKEVQAAARPATAPSTRDATVSGNWYLRLEGGELYGPVSEGELYAWAADCRIGPGQQVSPDQTEWIAVETIPELRMRWHVKLVNGARYGPLNAFAVPHLIREGVVCMDSPLTHGEDGPEEPLADVLVAEAAAVKKRAADRISELRRRQSALSSTSPPRTVQDRLRKNGK